jgi:hypothetical protein
MGQVCASNLASASTNVCLGLVISCCNIYSL